MKQNVMLSIKGKQCYQDQEPEIIELVTEGTLEKLSNGWELLYQESDLTGMDGVTTSFLFEPGRIILTRSGKLKSQMIFVLNQPHESLYQMPFGALMLTVCATKISFDLSEDGGVVDLDYSIEIEQSCAGMINYHLEMRKI